MSYRELSQWIEPFTDRFSLGLSEGFWAVNGSPSLTVLADEVTRQASNIGYINVFHLFLWASLLAYPLIAFIAWPPNDRKT